MDSKQVSLMSWLNDARIRGILFQVFMIAALVAGGWWIANNTLTNLEATGKTLGFGFLDQAAGFQISQTFGTWLFNFEAGKSTYLDVYFIGIVNTFVVAIMGIFLATIIGFTMGVMRLSKNFILRGFATVYVEALRNIPLLLQLFFWYYAVVLVTLPGRREVFEIVPGFVGINITGLYMPAPLPQAGFFYTIIAFGIAVIAAIFMARWARKRQERTGQIFPAFWAGVGLIIGLPLIVLMATGNPLDWSIPVFKETGPKLRQGYQSDAGMTMVPEMIAVLLALSLYTAAFIAEIVRAGILSVNKGQTEASYAVALRPSTTLRLVVIPQALRVIIPPLTSQYLNLTKNSSLAVAIAYPDLVSIFSGTALSQVGKEIEMVGMMMVVYLTFSLLTATLMNWFNSRVKLVER